MTSHAHRTLARFTLSLACAALLATGCGKPSATTPQAAGEGGVSPRERIAELAKRYRDAKSYQDAGELRLLVDGAPEDEFRSMPFSVTLERPNRLRVHALDTTSVADGEKLRSIVQSLPGQILVRDCPANVDLKTLTADEMLGAAMRGQLAIDMPQLTLLLSDDPAAALTRDSTPEQLSDSEFQGEKCWRIALAGPSGKGVMWIEKQSGLLVKYEFPLDDIRKKFPLAKLWAEFRGATAGEAIDPVAFQVELPADVKLVNKFVTPPPAAPHPLLAKSLDKFTFVALDGTAWGNESLANKVVVIDLWATWCGWCFEGLPLLEKVYQQYKDNDQVVFLAVSKDDLAVTNAAVEEAFKKHNLTVPIARDQEQLTDKLFQLEGLPTTIVLGRDGTVQDYHIGYDAQLADKLPAKLEKLLAGENLAQPELDAYELEKKEFEARLSEVLIEGSGDAQPEVARNPSTTNE
jgi:thiol-disulfide isomerase/thioredoxin